MTNPILKFIRNLVGYYELEQRYKKETEVLEEEADEQSKIIADLKNEIKDLKIEKQAAKDTIQEMIHKEKVDILDVKSWYENKFPQEAWTYNFRAKGNEDVKYAFRFDKKDGKKVLRELSEEIIERYNMEKPTPKEVIERVKQYFRIRRNWTYRTDLQEYDMREYWAPVDVSIKSRRGDCDSLALVMHMLIRDIFDIKGLQEHKWRLKLTASTVLGEGGHAFNIWLHDDGEWYVIESTYDLAGSFSRTWLKTPMRYNNLYQRLWGFARPDRSFRGTTYSALESYREV